MQLKVIQARHKQETKFFCLDHAASFQCLRIAAPGCRVLVQAEQAPKLARARVSGLLVSKLMRNAFSKGNVRSCPNTLLLVVMAIRPGLATQVNY
jgi:hypothetical protein